MVRIHSGLPSDLKVPRLRSGFRHAARTPRKRLKFESIRAYHAFLIFAVGYGCFAQTNLRPVEWISGCGLAAQLADEGPLFQLNALHGNRRRELEYGVIEHRAMLPFGEEAFPIHGPEVGVA